MRSIKPRFSAGQRWLLAGASAALAATIAASAASQTQKARPMDDAELERVGEQTMEKICNTACHTLDKVFTIRRTAREWGDVMINMTGRGTQGTDEQMSIVKRYLTRYFGIVSVNSAPAEELSAVMGFSAKEASAIVEYRKTHGKFSDVAALLKVDGIDKARIEEQPEALRFDQPVRR